VPAMGGVGWKTSVTLAVGVRSGPVRLDWSSSSGRSDLINHDMSVNLRIGTSAAACLLPYADLINYGMSGRPVDKDIRLLLFS